MNGAAHLDAVTGPTTARRAGLDGRLDRVLGIPRLGPEAAAVFRVTIGLVVTWLIWNGVALAYPTGLVVPLEPGVGYGVGTWPLSHWLRSHPDAHQLVYRVTLAAGGAFIVGLWSRLAAVLLWCGLFLLIGASLATSGNHTWGAPLLALFGVVLAPLGDAWSLDSLARRRLGRRVGRSSPSALYGFAIWWIGLVLGLAFLAAAYAKLNASGLAWATGGAIRYHFVEDASHAPVAWGIWIAGQPALAVALSTAGLLIEATLILVTLCRRDRYRAAFGAAFLSIHVGFFLFQGVLWLPWMAMSVAFLPWETISNRLGAMTAAMPPARIGAIRAIAVLLLVALQVSASVRRIEYEPLLSNYPMYSGTFSSWEEFFALRRWHKFQTYRLYVRAGDRERVEIAAPSALLTGLDVDRVVDTLRAAYQGDDVPDRSVPALAALHDRLAARFGPDTVLEVDVDVQAINFDRMRFELAADDLHAFTLRLAPPTLEFVAPEFRALLH